METYFISWDIVVISIYLITVGYDTIKWKRVLCRHLNTWIYYKNDMYNLKCCKCGKKVKNVSWPTFKDMMNSL